jgi:hypothetical protein
MDCSKRPTILIASSTWWAFPAKLAVAFAATGAKVDAVCPSHNPLDVTGSLRRRFRYSATNPLKSLERAIASVRPALIVPCDDRAVGHLHALHSQCRIRCPEIADVIEISLGDPESFGIAERRSDLIGVARKLGISAPRMLKIATKQELAEGLSQVSLPAIMKVDGTWGGLGVELVHSAEQAAATFAKLSRPWSVSRAILRFLIDRDLFSLPPSLHRKRPVVNIQRFVSGRPANCAVACWGGEVVSYIGAEVLSASSEFGASCTVRIIEHADMRRAATGLARQLGLSGFCGFDFVIDATGVAHLIEMNARATPLTHLALGPGRDPVTALSSLVLGSASLARPTVTDGDIISFFPQALNLPPTGDVPRTGFYDVPWEEPELVRELVRRPWPERGLLATLVRWAKKPLGSWERVSLGRMLSLNAARSMTANDEPSSWSGGDKNWANVRPMPTALLPRSAIDRKCGRSEVRFSAD